AAAPGPAARGDGEPIPRERGAGDSVPQPSGSRHLSALSGLRPLGPVPAVLGLDGAAPGTGRSRLPLLRLRAADARLLPLLRLSGDPRAGDRNAAAGGRRAAALAAGAGSPARPGRRA